jgi:hypothetical protein
MRASTFSRLAGLLAGCLFAAGAVAQDGVTPLDTPASDGSGMYSLYAAPEGATFLSWIEEAGEGHALRFSELQRPGSSEEITEDAWGEPKLIAEGSGWFANWADHPNIALVGENRLVAHYLVRNPEADGHYGYGLKIVYSMDRGVTWREVFSEGLKNVESYSGFVSFTPEAGGFSAAYLTPPPGSKDPGDMTLRLARFHEQGYQLGNQRLDPDVCSCCPTAMATIDGEPAVVYRDRVQNPPEDDLRDIAIARKIRGLWEPGRPVHPDGWSINACPVNGPTIAASGDTVAVAWFTMAGGEPEVRFAFSQNGGEGFGAPIRLDGGNGRGYTAVTMLDDGSAVAAWLETPGGERGEVRVRRVWPDGLLGESLTVAESPAGREAGILQLVRVANEPPPEPEEDETGDEADEEAGGEEGEDIEEVFDVQERLLVAWRDGKVRTALIAVSALEP